MNHLNRVIAFTEDEPFHCNHCGDGLKSTTCFCWRKKPHDVTIVEKHLNILLASTEDEPFHCDQCGDGLKLTTHFCWRKALMMLPLLRNI